MIGAWEALGGWALAGSSRIWVAILGLSEGILGIGARLLMAGSARIRVGKGSRGLSLLLPYERCAITPRGNADGFGLTGDYFATGTGPGLAGSERLVLRHTA